MTFRFGLKKLKPLRYTPCPGYVSGILRQNPAKGELGVTRIMYHSFLSYPYVSRFLGIARDTGLLDYEDNKRSYKISRKGLEYLKFSVKIESHKNEALTFSITIPGLQMYKF